MEKTNMVKVKDDGYYVLVGTKDISVVYEGLEIPLLYFLDRYKTGKFNAELPWVEISESIPVKTDYSHFCKKSRATVTPIIALFNKGGRQIKCLAFKCNECGKILVEKDFLI